MALQFILGNSGSGKTEYLYRMLMEEAVQNPKKNYLVVVPEQFTMETQQKLVDFAPGHAIINVDVLSFDRLAYRIFDELGITNLRILEESGKNLVLRKLARDEEEQLSVMRPNLKKMGYISEVKSLLSEFMQYHITCEDLKNFVENASVSPVLAAKLRDLQVMYEAFLAFLKERYITAEEILSLLVGVAKDSNILNGCVVAFDEFTGFTPVQNELIKELLPLVQDMYVTLTIDVREHFYTLRGKEELFAMTKETILSLSDMAVKTGVAIKEPFVCTDSEKKRFKESKELAFLEKNLFRSAYERYEEEPKKIHITAAKNPVMELTAVAGKIAELIREGFRYRDIAVVTASIETYQSHVEPVFLKYQIPYFMDDTKELVYHPVVEFIRATLAVIEEDFSYRATMRFLRCGFLELEESEIDQLDNYLLATGIKRRSGWERRFSRRVRQEQDYDLDRLEKLRQNITALIFPLADCFKNKEASVKDGLTSLYQFLSAVHLEQTCEKRASLLLMEKESQKAKEYEQIYVLVMQLLEKYNLLLGEEKLEISSFTEVLEAGLTEAKVAVIPPGFDCVTIGDIERTRLNHIKVLFFVGVNDGIVPKSAAKGGIISEYEREFLLESNLKIAPGAREQAFIQRFYLYRNLTKPSQRLYLSFSKSDAGGKGIRPSYLIQTLQKMFVKLEIEDFLEENAISFATKDAAFDYLLMHKRDASWYALAKLFFEDERYQSQVKRLVEAEFACYKDNTISKGVAEVLYGRTPVVSVTRLEKFAACAYSHYLSYGLKLQEREESGLSDMDMGNLYHTALEKYSHMLEKSAYDWFTIPDESRKELADKAMEETLISYPNIGLYEEARTFYQLDKMKGIFNQTVWALTKQVRAGKFVPKEYEISYAGLKGQETLAIELKNGVSMRLNGCIDRMDTFVNEQGLYVKIIDYKSGSTSFDLVQIYQGLQLQLFVYLNTAMEILQQKQETIPVLPGGVFYYHITEPVMEQKDAEDVTEEKILSLYRPDGLLNEEETVYRAMDELVEGKSAVIPLELKKNGEIYESRSKVISTEEFKVIQDYVMGQVKKEGQAIYEGVVTVNPYQMDKKTACEYCPYSGICGIDSKLPGYEKRVLEKVDKDTILDRMLLQNKIQES